MKQPAAVNNKTTSKKANAVVTKSQPRELHQATSHPELRQFLADSFVLYMKTYAVHWNYQGEKFFAIHKLTEEHYQQLAEAIDEIAERIRAIKDEAPFSLASILESSNLAELTEDGGCTDRSVRDLANSHIELSAKAKEIIKEIGEEDPFTADMLTARIGAHEKANWMLKSLLVNN